PARDFLRVQRRIVVHAVGIGVEYVLHTERQFAVVFPVDGVPHAHQPDEIIRYGCFAAFYRRELAARGERRFLDGGEIVFAMGEGQTERDIGIPLAKDMRHAEIIALDADVILRGFGDENAIIRFARLGEPIERDQPAERQKRQADQKRQSDFEIPHDFPELATPARLERATPSLEGWCSIQLSYGARPDGPDSNSDGFARASMAPGDFPVEAEIVGIGLGDGLGSVGLEDLEVDAVLFGVGDGFFLSVEFEQDLLAHVGRRRPAHQRVDAARGFGLVFQDPLLGARPARLHGVPGGLVDTRAHDLTPSHQRSASLPSRSSRQPARLRASALRRGQPPLASRAKAGRGGVIRTRDPLLPKQMRYQTAPRPVRGEGLTRCGGSHQRPWKMVEWTFAPSRIWRAAARPPLISSTACTGSADLMDLSDRGLALAAMVETVPSARMNRMSSGMSVFFIQNDIACGGWKANSMPSLGGICWRYIRPVSCSDHSIASWTLKRCGPNADSMVTDSVGRSSCGWLEPAQAVPAKSRTDTNAIARRMKIRETRTRP